MEDEVYDQSTEDEEDWMDTNWDSVHGSSNTTIGQRRAGSTVASTSTSQTTSDQQPTDKGASLSLMTRMQLNDHKAGMQGLDKDHINHIIYEASKGSRFFENERRKEEQVQQRIHDQERRRRLISDSELQKGKVEADKLVEELNLSRDLTQTIVHVDMDAFYAAVEMRDNPSLRDKPMAVGGIGMLSTSNYEARKFGVRAAMPGFIGKKLCPQLVIVPLNFAKYREVSEQVRQIFADYDPNFCPMSLDEAYLNFTEHVTKRQTLPAGDRSFIKRCQTPADASLCCCDLNVLVREPLLKSRNMEMSLSSPELSTHERDVNGNIERVAGTTENSTSHVQVLQSKEVPSSSVSSDTEQGFFRRLLSTNLLENRKVESNELCPSCGKVIPPFELVTFGVDVESAVQEMRCRIEQRTCLTASAGISLNMMLSKVCSDQNKPNGQFFLPAQTHDIVQFVYKLPIRKISGIGRVSEQLLGALGIVTCSDLLEKRALLYHLYSPVSFSYFMRVACGVGSTQVARASEEDRKSMSTEQTFGELNHPEDLYNKCMELCRCLADDLTKEQVMGKTISLKLKTTDFQVRTRAQTLPNYTRDAEVMFVAAKKILKNEILSESPKALRLRLMGVRMSKLVPESECPQEKQNTIVGFFKKSSTAVKTDTSVSAEKEKLGFLSSEFRLGPCINEPGDSSEQNTVNESSISDDEPLQVNTLVDVHVEDHRLPYLPFHQQTVTCTCHTNICCKSHQSHLAEKEQVNVKESSVRSNVDISLEPNVGLKHRNEAKSSEDTPISFKTQEREAENCSGLSKKRVGPQITPAGVPEKIDMSSASNVLPGTSSFADGLGAIDCDVPAFSDSHNQENSPRQNSVHNDAVTHCFSVREPFTCPVCCKAVDCINLTDFNAHIDKCLQQESNSQPTSSQHPASKMSPGTKPIVPHTSRSNQSNVTKSAHDKKQKQSGGSQIKPVNISSACSSIKSNAAMSHSKTETHLSASKLSVETSTESIQAVGLDKPDSMTSVEDDEYMVCPLCGAERTDWTLDTFNQHVDACLNRGTISQILHEQRFHEETSRKRPAASHKRDHAAQQGKKVKKNESPKTNQSILSFFKT